MPEHVLQDLLIIVTAGLVANLLCQRLGVSTIVGYLVAGLFLGDAVTGVVASNNHDIELVSEAGVFLLLFTVGLEFSIEELRPLAWRVPVAGALQMALVAGPVAVVCHLAGLPWAASLLVGAALAFSSTVVVFKALGELGQTSTPHGRRAIGVLLFQDMALVPLLLVAPLLAGGNAPDAASLARLAGGSLAFIGTVALLRIAAARWVTPKLAELRSPDGVVLLAVTSLGGMAWFAYWLGLPPALGAFAAGLLYGGSRHSAQVDALVLPFRETFAAVFFVSLGLLLDGHINLLWFVPTLLGLMLLKALAAAVAMAVTGLRLKSALGMGIGLAHVGEFAFFLGRFATNAGVVPEHAHQQMTSLALASLLVTPLMLRLGMRWTGGREEAEDEAPSQAPRPASAVVIGVGPVGKQVASYLELRGIDVAMVDRSPVNLYPFSQVGFHTAAGDAGSAEVLRAARANEAELVVICVPRDADALRILKATRQINREATVVVRCRYQANAAAMKRAGAKLVVSEERQTYERLIADLAERLR